MAAASPAGGTPPSMRSSRHRSHWCVVLTLLVSGWCAAFSAACNRSGNMSPANTVIPPETPRPAVAAGDVLVVEVFGEKDLSGKFQVSEQGTIDYPLVGRLEVGGQSPPEVATLIRQRLADGFLRDPHVRVFAEGYDAKKKIYVWGQVTKAGTFGYTTGMTVIEAITLAGGVTAMAHRGGITVSRNESGKIRRYTVDLGEPNSATYALRPGDVIFVPERVF